ncbi:uncharacterized protein LACBIDRAFT_332541 [Laccaria bicolor S238N-H82]|uniref:Predicted protein n=1 Tax=Laccaria bicolor (strain S238N-H82 / ATCC MYA-4686) TaxID=486041 RepID=B0DT30_LACBS|nr:uncharacterized protein LACBIDRAFT_332541 [Laccaria bicolor S238N-H82]EDR02202.1 predicted protein [Laccaria bicolor S238N-H82]|eukprot:XP_001887147.1 predicted protein [Laccaria bicolor S238N-H82]
MLTTYLKTISSSLSSLVFRWLAIPWLQSELDKWVIVRNRTPPRANTKKVLPHGIPELMREKPEQFGALNFKIPVPTELIDRLEAEFAPPDHPVFQLTPPLFNQRASPFYSSIGSPMITFRTFWDMYRQLLHCFRQDLETDHDEAMASLISSQRAHTQEVEEDSIPLMEGLRELRQGDQVVGAYNHDGDGSDYASFTNDSDEESEANLQGVTLALFASFFHTT